MQLTNLAQQLRTLADSSDEYKANIRTNWNAMVAAGTFQAEVAERCLQPILSVNAYSVQESIAANMPTIAAVKKYRTIDYVVSIFQSQIAKANLRLNVTRPMDRIQIGVAAVSMANNSEFLHLTPTDIAAAFNRGLQGKYASLYEGFDEPKITAWLTAYDAEKTAEVQKMRMSEHGAQKAENKRSAFTPEIAKIYTEKMQELQKVAVQKEAQKATRFYDLRNYCNYHNIDFSKKKFEFYQKAWRDFKLLNKVDLSKFKPCGVFSQKKVAQKELTLNLIFGVYFKKRLYAWLKAVNEQNGYVYRHNGTKDPEKYKGIYVSPDHANYLEKNLNQKSTD